jgi:hypothetical protein
MPKTPISELQKVRTAKSSSSSFVRCRVQCIRCAFYESLRFRALTLVAAQPFTAPVLPVSASPLMQPASTPVIAALAQHGAPVLRPPLLSLSCFALPSAHRAGGNGSHHLLRVGLPPLPPSTKHQGVLHKLSPSNAASSLSHAHAAAAAQ